MCQSLKFIAQSAALLMLSIVFTSCVCYSYGRKFDDVSSVFQYDVPHIICRYIGIYHEHPANGQQLMSHLKADMLKEGGDTSLLAGYSKIFLDRRNTYHSDYTKIYDSRHKIYCKVEGSLDTWFWESRELFFYYKKITYQDKYHNLVWDYYESDTCLLAGIYPYFRGGNKQKVYVNNIASLFGDKRYYPYVIRVLYSSSQGVSLPKQDVMPDLYVYDVVDNLMTKVYWGADQQAMYKEYITKLLDELKETREFDNLDAYFPLVFFVPETTKQ